MHCRTRPPLAETMADLEIFEIGAADRRACAYRALVAGARLRRLPRAFRGMGMQATGEACIQYLCMTEDDMVRLGGRGKCNPPFRTAAEVERMWAASARGQDRLCLHRSRAVAAGAQDAARHLRLRRRADRACRVSRR
jgi:allantoinase